MISLDFRIFLKKIGGENCVRINFDLGWVGDSFFEASVVDNGFRIFG